MTTDATVGRFLPRDLILEGDTQLATLNPRVSRIALSIEQASQLVLSVSDPTRKILRSSELAQASRLAVGPLEFGLTGLAKKGPDLDLTFTDLGAVDMSRLGADGRVRAVPAGIGTRGDFLAQLAAETDWAAVHVFTGGDPYQPGQDPQPASTPATGDGSTPAPTDPAGLAGVDAVVAAAAHPEGGNFTGEALVESVAVSLAENQDSNPAAVGNNNDGTTDNGYWQINSIHPFDPARIFEPIYNASWARRIKDDRDKVTGGEGWRAYYAHTPYTPPGQPKAPYGSGERFIAALPTARAAVDRYQAGQTPQFTEAHHGLEVGTADQPTENLWTATGRIAGEVDWRRFAAAGEFYAGPDEWLAALTPPVAIRELTGGIGPIDFDSDVGVDADEASFSCDTRLWTVRPGQAVIVQDLGPASGQWIVAELSRTGGATRTDIKLTRTRPALPEPSNQIPDPEPSSGSGDAPISGSSDGSFPPLTEVIAVTDGTPPPATSGGTPTIDISGAWAGSQAVCEYLTNGFALTLTLVSAKRDRKNTKGGGVSDHWTGNTVAYAQDWSNGSSPTPEMDAAARTVIARLGGAYDGTSELVHSSMHVIGGATYRVQVLYRTFTGGNHFNHPHVGVARR